MRSREKGAQRQGNPEDIEIMRDALFGARKDDTGIMEAIVKLLDM